MTTTEAMQAAGGQSGYAIREACDFLLNRLEAGPVNAEDILEEAKHNAISPTTLKRAKKKLKIRSIKKQDNWTWELPAKPRTVADP